MMFFLTFFLAMLSLSNAAEPVPKDAKNAPISKGLELLLNDLHCPSGTFQWGEKWQDIMNCGMDHCFSPRRFGKTMEQCRDYCMSRRMEGGMNSMGQGMGCTVFSWAPVGGDMNHPDTTVCTLHNRADCTINEDHGPNQIMCNIDPPPGPCPTGTIQYGELWEDIRNCGMDHCMSPRRFNKPNKEACRDYCVSRGCAVFSWAEVGGDMNHMDTTVCTLHSWDDRWINEDHGPNQCLCRNLLVKPHDLKVYRKPWYMSFGFRGFGRRGAFAAVGLLGLMSLVGGVAFYKYKGRTNYEEISAEETTLL